MDNPLPQVKSVLTPGAFLVRGLLVGLVAGLLAFVVAYAVGEPHVERAIEREEAGAGAGHSHAHGEHGEDTTAHQHGDAAAVERSTQRGWGLLTGTLAIGLAYGGIVALAVAGAVGRLGALGARQTTGLVALLGFVSTVLVPFLKYPANPPAVGNPDTIGTRTTSYFALQLLCVVAAVAAVWLAVRLARRLGGFEAGVAGAAAYVVVVGAAAVLLPTFDEVGDFPGDLLWSFRVSSLLTSAALWAVLGVGLVALVGRLHDRAQADAARRALAAAL